MKDELLFNLFRRLKGRWTGKASIGLEQAEVDEINAVLGEIRAQDAAPASSEPQGAPPPASAVQTGLRDPSSFYGLVRRVFGGLSQSQVDGFEILLKAMGVAGWPIAFAAYGLATAWHETAHTMQPIKERGNGDRDGDGEDDHFEKYDVGDLARRLGNTPEDDNDGGRNAGRGYVQLTGAGNYRRADEKLDLGGALVADPDLAMRPDIAAQILVRGMEEGWFTTRKLGGILPSVGEAGLQQFIEGRPIINGRDRAAPIAAIAVNFQSGLRAGGWQ